MSLKCSLFGHRYGDTEVRRDREQDGSEFVETVREVKVCARCGEELVISETTEVTTVEAADETGSGTDTSTGTGGIDSVGRSETGRSGGTPRSAGTTGPPATSGTGPGDVGSGGAGAGAEDSSEPATESSVADPDVDAGAGGSQHGTPERDIPPAHKDDAVILDDDDDEGSEAEWPDESDEETDDWEPETEPEEELSVGRSSGLTVPEGEFYCPECGFTTPVESSSLREGDFCPECHRGALEHRAE